MPDVVVGHEHGAALAEALVATDVIAVPMGVDDEADGGFGEGAHRCHDAFGEGGKLIVDGLERGFYSENYDLSLEPLGCIMLVNFAFVMLGISRERVFNTKLRRS